MDQKDNSKPLFKPVLLDPEAGAAARAIYKSIADARIADLASQFEELERNKMAEWAAVCRDHTNAVEPLKALIDPSMNEKILRSLWDYNQKFLQQLAGFESAAQVLENQGLRKLRESLTVWNHDTHTTNLMIQYVLNSRQPAATTAANPVPARIPSTPSPAATLDQQALLGIWDITLADGRRVELALDNSSFSYAQADGTFAYWGDWSLYPNSGGYPLMSMTRKGTYPVRFYGPLGASDPFVYAEHETWNITGAQGDRINFGNVFMVRRKGILLPLVTSRISDVQTQFKLADARDKNNAAMFAAQRTVVNTAQNAMWDYINSGAGRYHGR